MLLTVDDALQVVDQSDQEKVRAEQGRVRTHKHEAASYERDWQAKRSQVRSASSLAGGSGRPKRNRKGSGEVDRLPAYPPSFPKGEVTQAQLARLTPPRGYIWTDHQHGGFQAHFKPFPRIDRSEMALAWRR